MLSWFLSMDHRNRAMKASTPPTKAIEIDKPGRIKSTKRRIEVSTQWLNVQLKQDAFC
jgi:hypothetical protein